MYIYGTFFNFKLNFLLSGRTNEKKGSDWEKRGQNWAKRGPDWVKSCLGQTNRGPKRANRGPTNGQKGESCPFRAPLCSGRASFIPIAGPSFAHLAEFVNLKFFFKKHPKYAYFRPMTSVMV